MVERVREEPGVFGFVSANGGYVTKHAFGVYSTTPPADGLRTVYPQDEVDARPRAELVEDWQGEAMIEGYTVMHDRDGNPETVIAACLVVDGRRTWAVGRDRGVAAAMTEGEWVGEKWHRRRGRAHACLAHACMTTSNSSSAAPCETGGLPSRAPASACPRVNAELDTQLWKSSSDAQRVYTK